MERRRLLEIERINRMVKNMKIKKSKDKQMKWLKVGCAVGWGIAIGAIIYSKS